MKLFLLLALALVSQVAVANALTCVFTESHFTIVVNPKTQEVTVEDTYLNLARVFTPTKYQQYSGGGSYEFGDPGDVRPSFLSYITEPYLNQGNTYPYSARIYMNGKSPHEGGCYTEDEPVITRVESRN